MSLKAKKVEPEYLEGDPVPLKEDPIYPEEPLSLKEEPLFLEEPLKEEPLSEEQPNCDPSTLADLYTDHEINNDVVIGPITLQLQDVAFATPVLEKTCEQLAPTKNVTRKAHRCYICQRTFIDDLLLINHVCIPQDVLDATTIPQTVSQRSCNTYQANNHRDKPNLNHNYSAGEPINCDICQKQFKHKNSLKYHTLIHSKRVLPCKICNLKFYAQNDLDAHHKYHVGFDNNYNIDEDTVVVVRIGVGRYVSAQRCTFTSIKDAAPSFSDVASLPKCSPSRQILIQDSSKLNSTAINEHFTKKYDQIEHQRKSLLYRNQGIQGNQPSPNGVVVNLNGPLLKYMYCEICKKEIKVKDNLNAHMMSHDREKQNFPQRSNQDIPDDPASATANPNDIAVNSNKHVLKHKKEKYLNCKAYKKELKVKNNSNAHMAERFIHKRIHMGEDKFICDICQKAFNRKNKLVTHIKYHLRPKLSKKQFSCDICEKKFLKSSRLIAHKLMHAPVKNYSCGICEKRFHIKGVLMKHIRYVHKGRKLFKCETCQKTFAYSSKLRQHEVLHGEKKLICKICGKKFHQKSGVRSHMTIHTVRDSFICDVCKRLFNRKTVLIGHIKVMHTECDSTKTPFFLYKRQLQNV